MWRKWPWLLAWSISGLMHLAILFTPGWGLPEPPGPATRIQAQLQAAVPASTRQNVPAPRKRSRSKPQPSIPAEGESSARLPGDAQAEDEVVNEAAVPQGDASAPLAEASTPVAPTDLSEAQASSLPPAAERIPRQGLIHYSGSASLIPVVGLVSWEHDGQDFRAQLGAGLSGSTSSFNFESRGRLVGAQLQAATTQDDRRGKRTNGVIDNAAGVVRMRRGTDDRERRINGLAVALSSLPQALACLDEKLEKAALFIVGDFWVEDAVVINRGLESLDLPGNSIEARHFQSRIRNGKTIDIWLVPAWRNAPARIRYDDGGVVVDLKAVEVEIDGKTLHKQEFHSGVLPPTR